MGARGPIPKRSDQRHGHRSLADRVSVTKLAAGSRPQVPPADESWHPAAVAWFTSLAESGQSVFYEASDWAYARYVAEAMSRNLEAGRFSAQLFAAVLSGMTELLTTEGARRRVRLELERLDDAPEENVVDYRARARTGT